MNLTLVCQRLFILLIDIMLRRGQVISTVRFVAAQFRLFRHFESDESLDDGLPTVFRSIGTFTTQFSVLKEMRCKKIYDRSPMLRLNVCDY